MITLYGHYCIKHSMLKVSNSEPLSYESTNGEVCSSCGSRVDKFLKGMLHFMLHLKIRYSQSYVLLYVTLKDTLRSI